MSTAKFDRIAAIAGESDSRRNIELADGRRESAHHVSPAVLEFRVQQVTAERDELLSALTKINNLNPEVDSDECWNGGEAHCFRQAQAIAGEILARINAQPLTPPTRSKP